MLPTMCARSAWKNWYVRRVTKAGTHPRAPTSPMKAAGVKLKVSIRRSNASSLAPVS